MSSQHEFIASRATPDSSSSSSCSPGMALQKTALLTRLRRRPKTQILNTCCYLHRCRATAEQLLFLPPPQIFLLINDYLCTDKHFVLSSFDSAVKFLREVTPYFRKASIICLEVGWELQRAFLCPLGPGSNASPPAPRSPPRADTRYIPLQLTHLARNLKHPDPGK